jgi:hypothetical protein
MMMEPPPAVRRMRDAVLGDPEDALEVDRHDAIPPLVVRLQHRTVAILPQHPGVVVEHVQRSEAPRALGDHPLDVGFQRDVAGDSDRLPTLLLDEGGGLCRRLAIDVGPR